MCPSAVTLFVSETDARGQMVSDVSTARLAAFSRRDVFIPRRVSERRRVNRRSRSHLQTFPSLWQAFHILHSDLRSAACHSNWLYEHQTWQTLPGSPDTADMLSCTDGKVKRRREEKSHRCRSPRLCIDVGLHGSHRVG